MGRKQNILVVGAGLSGSVVARELANAGKTVKVIDRRKHIAGNCYDYWKDGVRVHKYGPHIFHTNDKKVFDWLSQYTEWVEYKHKVKAYYKGQYLTLPPNKQTKEIDQKKNLENLSFVISSKWALTVNSTYDRNQLIVTVKIAMTI